MQSTLNHIDIVIAHSKHNYLAKGISKQIAKSAKDRGTGIALRSTEYIQSKINTSHAIIAFDKLNNTIAGFCYIESWQAKNFVSNSGLIIFPNYRGIGLARKVKKKALELASTHYPNAKFFGLTTSPQVMKINCDLGYRPVTYQELTQDQIFWQGCQSCVNFSILQAKNHKNCLCTAMLYDPKWFKKEEKVKLILAFSGGLDTSYCAKYLVEAGYEVYSVTVNTGGFDQNELKEIEKRSLSLGVTQHINIEATKDFYQNCVKYLLFGNVLKNNCYPLSVSAERAFQARVIANYANEHHIQHIAHGCTGAGNDQVRFDLMFHVLCPDVKIITPIRDQKLSRKETADYLKSHGIDCPQKTQNYSVNKGLWGTSVGGVETLSSNKFIPEKAWPTQMTKGTDDEIVIKVSFYQGEPVALNDEASSPICVINKLQAMAGKYGIGRDIHVGDTVINIKGRVGFEAAAPMILIKAHHALEKHVLTKSQLKTKELVAANYGEMTHEGQFLDPALRDIEALLCSSQKHVTGDVFVMLKPWHFYIVGCQSRYDLMADQGAVYGEENNRFSADDVKGFSKILSNQLQNYQTKVTTL